jgi:Protein of unknown function (DUF1566)
MAAGCKDDKEPEVEIKLGANYGGGIIYYLDGSGKHGLIAATADQNSSAPWWNQAFLATGALSTTDGSANTNSIIAAQGNTGSYAAKLCKDYQGGGFKDWFLPSKDQLNTLYTQKTLVGGFSESMYWSSTEFETGSVWVQYFLNGEQNLDNTSDGAGVHTRAVRVF